ncbi:DeoR family transcriptional regulator [Salana multivorans]|uniref:Lactose phosphotransferase system repressor n=1 Tax=Salana multivorans TaxID=120377 RepID=A0A3N2DC93_9MICO|nr:DeoR/GlpR family DNA-binding transcription regulator [Salana multivorans]MBN8880824.1 DeoR/GlpR transcriptional regulator [Salana multivorans]OJX97806.1 MAG: D-beta-D-heptose 1-phosphate adenosyltransferase [Micrococcales bacterium 73-15]ROR97406.1 DeoR family transcriptional regulator [Salana multivorans]
MYAPERHAEIVMLARADGRVDVTALAARFDVATETIRRDLTALERRGLLRRVHGGAVALERLPFEPTVVERDAVHTAQKDAIAQAALAEIGDATTILIDGGTTTARLVQVLPTDRQLTVITQAIPIANALAQRDNVTLLVVGGTTRGTTLTNVGPWATSAISTLTTDLAFLGTNGLTLERGLSTRDVAEAEVKRAITGAARRVVVLADHSKIGHDELVTFAQLEAVDTIVTDAAVDAHLASEIAAAGVEVVRA